MGMEVERSEEQDNLPILTHGSEIWKWKEQGKIRAV